jgi:dTDP-3-amino-3,4,6-trideoxy-alpha-D-glucose transaminase
VPFLDLAALHSELVSDLEEAVGSVLRSGRYIQGPEVKAFESEFASQCGVDGAVGVANGLEALQLALLALEIGPGDEVIVPAHTYIATWLAVTHTGARPVPIEPDPETMQIDPARVPDAIGPNTAAILPVHLYGIPADVEALSKIARGHGLALVEDASQAHGASLNGCPVGSFGDAAGFSLYPTKNLGALGDAGIVVSADPTLLERVRMLGNYGERHRNDHELRGHNSRLDELQAAVLRVKLRRLESWNDSRRTLAEQYLRRLENCPGVTLPSIPDGSSAVWHQFVVRVPARDKVRHELADRGIETLIHYPVPPHRAPAYAGDYPDRLPITDALAVSVLSLPISPELSVETCAYVCETLREVMADEYR